jgi:hypothetical protein
MRAQTLYDYRGFSAIQQYPQHPTQTVRSGKLTFCPEVKRFRDIENSKDREFRDQEVSAQGQEIEFEEHEKISRTGGVQEAQTRTRR